MQARRDKPSSSGHFLEYTEEWVWKMSKVADVKNSHSRSRSCFCCNSSPVNRTASELLNQGCWQYLRLRHLGAIDLSEYGEGICHCSGGNWLRQEKMDRMEHRVAQNFQTFTKNERVAAGFWQKYYFHLRMSPKDVLDECLNQCIVVSLKCFRFREC